MNLLKNNVWRISFAVGSSLSWAILYYQFLNELIWSIPLSLSWRKIFVALDSVSRCIIIRKNDFIVTKLLFLSIEREKCSKSHQWVDRLALFSAVAFISLELHQTEVSVSLPWPVQICETFIQSIHIPWWLLCNPL